MFWKYVDVEIRFLNRLSNKEFYSLCLHYPSLFKEFTTTTHHWRDMLALFNRCILMLKNSAAFSGSFARIEEHNLWVTGKPPKYTVPVDYLHCYTQQMSFTCTKALIQWTHTKNNPFCSHSLKNYHYNGTYARKFWIWVNCFNQNVCIKCNTLYFITNLLWYSLTIK